MRLPFSFWQSGNAPTVTSISPPGGPTTGGTSVTIHGTGFTGQSSAKVGGVALSSFNVVNDTTITGTTGAGMSAGFVDVQVGTSGLPQTILKYAFCTLDLTGWWRGDDYNHLGTPQLPGSPSGGTSGAHPVDVSSGSPGTGASLNGHPSISILRSGPDQFSAAWGGGVVGADLITETSWSGWALINTSSITTNSTPNVLSNNMLQRLGGDWWAVGLDNTGPNVIPVNLSGGGAVLGHVVSAPFSLGAWHLLQYRYDGTNMWVRIDGGPWTSGAVAPIDAGHIGSSGFDLFSANFQGLVAEIATSKTSYSDAQFDQLLEYCNVHYGTGFSLTPSISSITPNVARASGGQSATIAGQNFFGVQHVRFVNGMTTIDSGGFSVTNPSSISVPSLPALASGTWDVVVVTDFGTATGPGLLTTTTLPIIYDVVPNAGTDAGGTSVTIDGANFATATNGDINGIALTSFHVVSDLQITAVTGASGSDGTFDVHVTNGAGTGTGAGLYTYVFPFDPATLNLTKWLRGSYAGMPWAGNASAGTSGSNGEISDSANDPTTGATLNTKVSARYAETAGSAGSSSSVTTMNDDIGNIVTASQYTVMGLIYLASADAFDATPYQNGAVMAGDARFSVFIDGSSGGEIGVHHYTGSFPFVKRTMSTGAWHFFCIRFGGGIGAGMVQIDIDNSPGTPTALANVAVLAGVPCKQGVHGFNSAVHSWQFDLEEIAASQIALSDTDRNNYYAYLKGRYPAAGLP